MANPFNANNSTPQNQANLGDVVNSFKQMMNMGNNPQQIMQVLCQRNPQLANIMNEIAKSGKSPIQYAQELAMNRNINISPALQEMFAMTKHK